MFWSTLVSSEESKIDPGVEGSQPGKIAKAEYGIPGESIPVGIPDEELSLNFFVSTFVYRESVGPLKVCFGVSRA